MLFHSHVERIDPAYSNTWIVNIRGMFTSLMSVGLVGEPTRPIRNKNVKSPEVSMWIGVRTEMSVDIAAQAI
jgi:hypothetical protein